VSEGYRLGGINSVPPCTNPLTPGQNVCALPDEVEIKSDTTTNYELGVHSQFGDSVILNGALYYIEWDDVQIDDVTVNGEIPITSNGGSATSQGVELSGQWYITSNLSISGSYAYTDVELTDDAPGLVGGEDAFDGDRLPGSPEHQGFLAANYAWNLNGGSQIDFDWSITATSNVLTKVGERDNGESLDGYYLHNASVTWFKDSWRVSLYGDNVFDQYAVTGVRSDRSFIGATYGDFTSRRYSVNVARPRQVGLRFIYNFDG
jgi:iron complex outermembrane receptor protein